MKLTFRTINGKNFNVEAEGTTLVSKLKADVEESQGAAFPKDAMKLVYKGKVSCMLLHTRDWEIPA